MTSDGLQLKSDMMFDAITSTGKVNHTCCHYKVYYWANEETLQMVMANLLLFMDKREIARRCEKMAHMVYFSVSRQSSDSDIVWASLMSLGKEGRLAGYSRDGRKQASMRLKEKKLDQLRGCPKKEAQDKKDKEHKKKVDFSGTRTIHSSCCPSLSNHATQKQDDNSLMAPQ